MRLPSLRRGARMLALLHSFLIFAPGAWAAEGPDLTPETRRAIEAAARSASLEPWQSRYMTDLARGVDSPRARTPLDRSSLPPPDRLAAGANDGTWGLQPPAPMMQDHSAIFDPLRRRMVVFGGSALKQALVTFSYSLHAQDTNDLWSLSLGASPTWTKLDPPGPLPTERHGHSAIYDPVRDRMIVFGGYKEGSGAFNDVWALSLTGAPAWTQLLPLGSPPSPRYNHTAVYDSQRDRMLVTGGPDNQVWALSLSGTPEWTQLATVGSPPVGRSAIYDPVRDRLVTIGSQYTSTLNEVWGLSLDALDWNMIAPTSGIGNADAYSDAIYDPVRDRMLVFNRATYALPLSGTPTWSLVVGTRIRLTGHYGRALVYDDLADRVITFAGGWSPWDSLAHNDVSALPLTGTVDWVTLLPDSRPPPYADDTFQQAVYDTLRDRMIISRFGNDVWAMTLTTTPTWTHFAPAGTTPIPREGPSMVLDPVRDRLVFFGGWSYDLFGYMGDAYALSLSGTPTWSTLSTGGTGREFHSAIYDPLGDRMVIYGGLYSDIYIGFRAKADVWALSLGGSPTWSQLAYPGTTPPARYKHTAIFDPVGARMVVFGGAGWDSAAGNGVWALSLTGTPAWSEIFPSGPLPAARSGHCAVYDSLWHRMIVTGGSATSETWELSLSAGSEAWRQLDPAGTPPSGRSGAAAIWDPIWDRMVVFGGGNGTEVGTENDVWDLRHYTLTVNIEGGGEVARTLDRLSYIYGENVTLAATPIPGWHFAGWSGDATGLTNPTSVSVSGNKTVTATFLRNRYTWNQLVPAPWTDQNNWTPTRYTPAADDVLLFTQGGVETATGVPTQTIAQLLISGGTTATLQCASAATLTIAGGAGADLDIASGSGLVSNGASALALALGSNATAAISGAVTMSGGAHRLAGLKNNGIVFGSGSQLTLDTGFSGNPFGIGTGTSALNSVVFQNGSLLVQVAGSNPFGAVQPSTVVTFQAGSRYRLDGALSPALAGRTYADFEYNVAASTSTSGNASFAMDSFVVSKGTLNVLVATTGDIKGDVRVATGASLKLTPSLGAAYRLSGTSPQSVNVFGSLTGNSNLTLEVKNAAGVTLGTDLTVPAILKFTAGKLFTGTNTAIVPAAGNVTGAAAGTGWVAGRLRRNIASGSSSRTFDIGDANAYAPVTLAVSGAASSFDLVASTQAPDRADFPASALDPGKSVNRWWTLSPVTSPTLSGLDATFGFAAADVDGGAVPANFVVARNSGGLWSGTTPGARTATSTQALALAGFGDFVIGELAQYTLTVSTQGSGVAAKSPDQPTYGWGTPVQLTGTPAPGWTFSGWSGDTVAAANPLVIPMISHRSITATFLDTTLPSITVTSPNGGETLAPGSSANLLWSASDNAGVTGVDLLLSRTGAGGPFDTLAIGLPNTGTWEWNVTGPGTTDAYLRAIAHDGAGNTRSDLSDAAFTITAVAGVEDARNLVLALLPVRPNPARDGARFEFALPVATRARLSVMDLQGREVAVLADGDLAAGRHSTSLAAGSALSPGLYFVRLKLAGRTLERRFVYLR